MHRSDSLNPKHDWHDRWNPILVREWQQLWAQWLSTACWILYPLGLVAAGWFLGSPQSGSRITLETVGSYVAFVVLALVTPLGIAHRLTRGLPREELENLLLSPLTPQTILDGYIQAGLFSTLLISGAVLPCLLAACCRQSVPVAHALLIVSVVWASLWPGCVTAATAAVMERFQTCGRDVVVGLLVVLLILLSFSLPTLLVAVLVPLGLKPATTDVALWGLDPVSDYQGPLLLILLLCFVIMYAAAWHYRRWACRLMQGTIVK